MEEFILKVKTDEKTGGPIAKFKTPMVPEQARQIAEKARDCKIRVSRLEGISIKEDQ